AMTRRSPGRRPRFSGGQDDELPASLDIGRMGDDVAVELGDLGPAVGLAEFFLRDLREGVAGLDFVEPGSRLAGGVSGEGEHLTGKNDVAVADLGAVEDEDFGP